jgi:hypothetical protein
MVLAAGGRQALWLVRGRRFWGVRHCRLTRGSGVALGVCRSSLIPRTAAIAACERALTITAPAAAAPTASSTTTAALTALATLTALGSHGAHIVGTFGSRVAQLLAPRRSGPGCGRLGFDALPRPLGRRAPRAVARLLAVAPAIAVAIGIAISATVTRAGAIAMTAISVATTAVAAAPSVVLTRGPVASLARGRTCGWGGCGWRCDRRRGGLHREPASQAM